MPISARVQNLQRLQSGPGLTGADLAALGAYGAKATWPANFQIYQCGGKAEGFSAVLHGHVILRNRMRSGRGFVPAVVTAGETFGIEGLTQSSVYVTDAHAAEETETLFLSTERFREFVRENPTPALKLIGQLLAERAQFLERLHEMASQNVEQRLLCALNRLSRDESFLADDGSLKLEVRHHRLLCEMVGATRESIALALGRLVGSGVASRNGTAFFVTPSVLDIHSSDTSLGDAGIPIADERWRASP
jgi:CRP-like cAMP-binding protein